MGKSNRRYLAGGGILILAMISMIFAPDCYYDELACKISNAFTTFLIAMGGAVMGAALPQVWAERDKKKDES